MINTRKFLLFVSFVLNELVEVCTSAGHSVNQ